MTYINPIGIAVVSAGQVQQQRAADATGELHRQQLARKEVAAQADRYEHVIQGAEAATPVDDDGPRDEGRPPPPKRKPEDGDGDEAGPGDGGGEPPHIDVTG